MSSIIKQKRGICLLFTNYRTTCSNQNKHRRGVVRTASVKCFVINAPPRARAYYSNIVLQFLIYLLKFDFKERELEEFKSNFNLIAKTDFKYLWPIMLLLACSFTLKIGCHSVQRTQAVPICTENNESKVFTILTWRAMI